MRVKNIFDDHIGAVERILAVFAEFSIYYILIGARARDLHFAKFNISSYRTTQDIDFAIMVNSIEEYQKILNKLKGAGFEETEKSYRLTYRDGQTTFDLLPYGGIEKNEKVGIGESIKLSVLGFKEIGEESVYFNIGTSQLFTISVAPIDGLFLMKLLSWDENKYERKKDIHDVLRILDNYWEFIENDFFENHIDLVEDNFDQRIAAGRVLGRNLKIILKKSYSLRSKVLNILKNQLNHGGSSQNMIIEYASEYQLTIDLAESIIKEIIKGVKEE